MGKENVLRFSLTVLSFKSVSIQLLRLFINVVVSLGSCFLESGIT